MSLNVDYNITTNKISLIEVVLYDQLKTAFAGDPSLVSPNILHLSGLGLSSTTFK